MEGSSVLSFSSSKTHLKLATHQSSSPLRQTQVVNFHPKHSRNSASCLKTHFVLSSPRSSRLSPPSAVTQPLETTTDNSSSPKEMLPKIDKSGRFCSPRAARELALLIVYASCLEGSDPIQLFEKRLNVRREPGYEFDKSLLLEYNHMSFGGPPISTQTEEEAEELLHLNEKESAIEAEVLSAPPKLVYSKLILRLAKKMLVAIVDSWDKHVLVIDKIAPPNWKKEPASRILELCILHLAMSEITVLGTRHQIIINEAVDLAKRFCDGTAPRIINGCLRTFVKNHGGTNVVQPLQAKR
ncbi:NusB/RsmB/TIM44 [Macleaya cordata]|uniref:NusB/RsmB/TIM44 n=1 Tax=Macleaya cordata TaxID=56857 RepID=A0A200R112_MACCD|nr:NusB/RsmB/TIM44 [Macleaya cordata]